MRLSTLLVLSLTTLSLPCSSLAAQTRARAPRDTAKPDSTSVRLLGTVAVGYASLGGVAGFAAGAGLSRISEHWMFHAGPQFILKAPSAAGEYYLDELVNGQTRCRRTSTGQTAPNNACANGYTVVIAFDGFAARKIKLTKSVAHAGVGYTVSETASSWYVIAGISSRPVRSLIFFTQASAGPRIGRIVAGLHFPI